ncbi:MAG: hypothetical protein CMO74_09440 [Verrucomicrobiales bacterium]|nr:hypothetical protein [Verrucomicrobiales bacterium]|tara:strand:- start:4588 stop:6336 length:1749 start_codon:yes stop_codon:yes gene_type:complete
MKTTSKLLSVAAMAAMTALSAPPAPPPAVPGTPAPTPTAQPPLPNGVIAVPGPAAPPAASPALPPGVVAVPGGPGPAASPAAAPGSPAPVAIPAAAPQPTPAASPVAAIPAAAPLPQLPPGAWIGKITGSKVNARGRATVFSFPVFTFQKQEPVLVLGEVTLPAPKAGDPRRWYRVQVPANVALFVHKDYVINVRNVQVQGPDGKPVAIRVGDVKASTLNVRAGPGQKYPILGRIPKGANVQLTDRPAQGSWMEILAPEATEVFVAAQFVAKDQVAMAAFGAAGGVASNTVDVPDPTSARITSGVPAGTPPGVAPPRPERPKPVEIISIPIKALAPTQSGAGGPTEAFPAPPIPVKQSRPTAPLKRKQISPGEGASKPGGPAEPGKIVSPTAPKPETGTKPAPEKVDVKEPQPPKPAPSAGEGVPKDSSKASPVEPTKPAEVAKVDEPKENTKPAELAKVESKDNTKPAELAKVQPKDNSKPAEAAKPAEPKAPVRIVTREGYVQTNINLQAPSRFVLEHIESGKEINFLFLDHPKLSLEILRGRRVLLTGEEAVDPRWPNLPVLKVQTLKTLDDTEASPDK